jgi:CSLREA domain-containing protein
MVSSRRPLALAAICFAALVAAAPASAATFTVNSTADNGDGVCDATCTIRDAVESANKDATKDTIVLPAGTFRLERFGVDDTNEKGDLDIDTPLTMQGTGPATTTINATGQDRVIDVKGAGVLLTGVTVTGGVVDSEGKTANDSGGGIRAFAGSALELDQVVVRGNLAKGIGGTGALGAGIYSEDSSLTLRNSAIVGNNATPDGYGGGVATSGETSVTSLTNVTIAQNSASVVGGGYFSNQEAKAELAFTTVVENEATVDDGGIYGDREMLLRSSIVARNVAPKNPDCESGPGSLGGNVGSASCGFTLPTDLIVADPLLAPLAGAGVPVAEPLPGSPAIDRGLAPCPATDARGVVRPQGGGCDSGAAERPVAVLAGPPAPSAPGGSRATAKISAVTVSQTKFRAGAKVLAHPGKGKTPVGTTISFRLSDAASVKGVVHRLVKGRKVGGNCLAATPVRKGKPRCTRSVVAGSLPSRAYQSGSSRIDFSGRLGGANLAPGRYAVELQVPSSGATATTPVLRIVP